MDLDTEATVVTNDMLCRLRPEDLEPSDRFARLVVEVGQQARIGTLGIAAIRELVHERIGYAPLGRGAQASVSARS